MDDKVTPDMEALELRLQEGEVDSQQVLEHQVKANRLLRQQLDDLQKRLDEKENQLIEANEIISALRDEVQTLQRQLMQQTSHQQLEQQTPHQQLEQQTPHQQLEQQTPHQQLEQQTPHQQLEQQTPHQQLEQQTPHQQLEQQTPHQQLEQQRRLKLTRQSTVALSPPRRRAPHKFVTFRVCLLSDPHMHILSRQKGNASRKIKVPTSLSAKEFHSFLRGAFPRLGNTDFQFVKVDGHRRIKTLQVSPVTPSVLKTSGELGRSALYILPKEILGKDVWNPQKRSHNAQETHTPPSVLERVTVQTDAALQVGNGDPRETMDTADADTSSNASDCHGDPDPDEPESGSSDTERSPQRSHKDQDVTSQSPQSPQLRPPLETTKDQDVASQTAQLRPLLETNNDQDVTSQTPQLRPPLETNCALKTSVYSSPANLLLICTSEDDPEDRPVSLSDVAEGPSQQVPLHVVSVNLEDCRGMLGPDGVYKIETENGDHGDEGSSDYDQHDDDDDDDYDDGDGDYDPTTEDLDSCSDDGDTACAPAEQRRDGQTEQTELDQKLHSCTEDVDSCSDDGDTACAPEEQRRDGQTEQTELEQKLHSCSECSRTFLKLNSLRAHQRRHHKKTSPPQRPCESKAQGQRMGLECKGQTGKRKTDRVKSHECRDCGKVFSFPSQLSVHQRVHTRKNPPATAVLESTESSSSPCKKSLKRAQKSYECKECGKMLSSASSLYVHQRIHTGERPYTCTECNKDFAQLGNFREHQRRHTQDRPYHCSLCSKRFITSTKLKEHIRIHTGERPYSCTQCTKSFQSSSALNVHQRSHTDDKPFLCLQCGKRFKTRAMVANHNKTHTGEKPHLCHYCGKTFLSSSKLVIHQRRHTGEKPHKCSECDSSFTNISCLKKHKRRHTGERPHLCSVCGKAFARVDALKTHQRVHTGEKPYQCKICEEKFSYIQSLQLHQKREHAVRKSAQEQHSTGTQIT
ncbi:uncharacterized protein LOC143127238 isoform X5 [Alosa pseudoharengus]|uniref:uncharacterized protein LOC143127238 isoform X5 n=1 Tax=Alosa pseudoharengus TaxID=34774 RepID=UPI003F8C0572